MAVGNRRIVIGLILALTGTAHSDNRSDILEGRLMRLGDVDPKHVRPAVEAALKNERGPIRAELLLALAREESRFRPDLRTRRVCGIMQVAPRYSGYGKSMSVCRRWRHDIDHAMRTAVEAMESMLRDPRVNGNIDRMLRYRSCGNAAFTSGCDKSGWIREVRRIERILSRTAERS